MISTNGYFAQILEGLADALDELMDSIHRDPRHRDVTTLRTASIERRSFPDWAMAYSGPSDYLAGRFAPLVGIDPPDGGIRVDRMIGLMTGLRFAHEIAA